jgi:polyphosphate kinase
MKAEPESLEEEAQTTLGDLHEDLELPLEPPPGPVLPVPRAVSPRPVPPGVTLGDPALYFNRELSWLDFNWRVLHLARDPRTPLLERVRFLSISQSNLDEFVRKRVGGLRRQQEAGVTLLSPDGRSPAQQLVLIRTAVREMQEALSSTWNDTVRPQLRVEGIVVRDYEELTAAEKNRLRDYFMAHIYPVLTPLAVDPGHPFPFISNLSLSLALTLRHPNREASQFARVKVPLSRGRWIPLDEPDHYLPLELLVARHMDELFLGAEIESVHAFRVTRNADLRRNEDEAEDLLQMISEELRERRFAPVVRLEVERDMPPRVLEMLRTELRLSEEEVDRIDGLIDLTHLAALADRERPDLLFPAWEPVIPSRLHPGLPEESTPGIFAALRGGDILVHHPYDSFTATVQRFVEEAAEDPKVLAIKMTLYRTSENSPVVHALIRAAERGKQVAVLVEVTARFDEQQNIEWAQILERAGVHVTYGLLGLKTHAKVTLVVREEGDRIRTYSHIGTGNYHSTTARIYTDLGLLTADEELGLDLVRLFHYLTGHAPEQRYRSLIVAPRDLRRTLEELILREIEHQRESGNGRIILKMNAIDDMAMIRALYAASAEGVRIDLIVRGHCRLRPGLPGVSENIRVVSIVGRFLEHDRIYFFENGGDHDVLIGSADVRRRNLVDRIEALVRIEDPGHRERLHRTLLHALGDNRLAWDLDSEGSYALRRPPPETNPRDYHRTLMKEALTRRAGGPGQPPVVA